MATWYAQAAQQLHSATTQQRVPLQSPRQHDMSREVPRPAGGAPHGAASRPVLPQPQQVRALCSQTVKELPLCTQGLSATA